MCEGEGVRLPGARGRLPVGEQRNERQREEPRRVDPRLPARHLDRLAPDLHFLIAEERREPFPDVDHAERGPHPPRGERDDEEVVAVSAWGVWTALGMVYIWEGFA